VREAEISGAESGLARSRADIGNTAPPGPEGPLEEKP
jgi:hypothetical protein